MGPSRRHAGRTMKIVAYSEGAFSEVVALWEACGLNVPYNDPAQDIALVQASPNATIFLGYRGDRLIGTIMVGHDGHRGWLYRLAVAPEFRKLGSGRALVRHAEAWLSEHRIRKAQLMIRDTNAAVRDFYVRVGYAAQPRLTMARWLDSGETDPSAKQIEVVITYLQMTERPVRPTIPAPAARLALMRVESPSVGFYRYLYNSVGEPWFWYVRRRLDDETLR